MDNMRGRAVLHPQSDLCVMSQIRQHDVSAPLQRLFIMKGKLF